MDTVRSMEKDGVYIRHVWSPDWKRFNLEVNLVNMVRDLICAEDENATLVVAALTHVASRLVQGSTIAHILRKHTTMTGGWFFF